MVQEALLLDGILGCIRRAFGSVSGAFGGVGSTFGGISSAFGGVGGAFGSVSSSRSSSVSFRRFRSRCRRRRGCRRGSRSGSRCGCRGRFFAAGGQTNRQQGGNEEGAIHDGNYPSKVKRFIPNLGGTAHAENPEQQPAAHIMPTRILSVFRSFMRVHSEVTVR